jgi:class 3 adenylate cyclase
MALTGVYVVISSRFELIPQYVLQNLFFLGGLNVAGAMVIYRPINNYVGNESKDRSAAFEKARRRLEDLPRVTMIWVFGLSVFYCTLSFGGGNFTPDPALVAQIPLSKRLMALAWFTLLFSTYYGFYTFFVVGSVAEKLRADLFVSHGLAIEPKPRRFRRKLAGVFAVAIIAPTAHLLLDVTWFRDVRQAQGFELFDTVLLDLFAGSLVFCATLFFVGRSLARPVGSLTEAMTEVAEGRLDARVPVNADDELGVMAMSFNRMAERLEEQAFIRDTFGKYVPQTVATAILSRREPLEPKLEIATILYADIEDFTAVAEKLEPLGVVTMLNEYFSTIIEPVEENGGVVNQFQGDAILATFNIPIADPEHADKAVDAALRIREAVRNREFGGVSLKARIGINTGKVVAGNVGSQGRLNYTVHGDAVNLAARIEQINKDYGTDLLISESTVAMMKSKPALREIGEVAVRGKTRTVRLYGLAVDSLD